MHQVHWALCAVALALAASACDGNKKLSAAKATEHVAFLAEAAQTDVQEIKNGLPEGAKQLGSLFERQGALKDDLPAVREALENARNKVQDLRVAKSTFFALVDEQGTILRNDQQQDLMTGKNAFQSFPAIKQALEGKYVESRGSMPEAAAVKGADGQWVAAHPVQSGGKVRGVYLTGWSWSAYAYRLENALRSTIKSEATKANAKMPLVYVYMVVERQAFGAPVSPEVNAKAIADQDPLGKAQGETPFVTTIEITGRDFGLAVRRVPALGSDVGVAVLRSET